MRRLLKIRLLRLSSLHKIRISNSFPRKLRKSKMHQTSHCMLPRHRLIISRSLQNLWNRIMLEVEFHYNNKITVLRKNRVQKRIRISWEWWIRSSCHLKIHQIWRKRGSQLHMPRTPEKRGLWTVEISNKWSTLPHLRHNKVWWADTTEVENRSANSISQTIVNKTRGFANSNNLPISILSRTNKNSSKIWLSISKSFPIRLTVGLCWAILNNHLLQIAHIL